MQMFGSDRLKNEVKTNDSDSICLVYECMSTYMCGFTWSDRGLRTVILTDPQTP